MAEAHTVTARRACVVICLLMGLTLYISRLLSGVIQSLYKAKYALNNISNGYLSTQHIQAYDVFGQDGAVSFVEISEMKAALKNLIDRLVQITSVANNVSSGNYDDTIEELHAKDELARAINQMIHGLRLLEYENQEDKWIKTSQLELATRIREANTPMEVCEWAVEYITDQIDGCVGIGYLLDEKQLVQSSHCYGVNKKLLKSAGPSSSHGLIERVVKSKRMLLLDEVPNDYFKIHSGLGESLPGQIVILPCLVNGKIQCLLEIAAFRKLSPQALKFVALIQNDIAISILAAKNHVKTLALLKETQQQSRELLDKQQTLKEINAELERVSSFKSEFLSNMSHELRTPLNSMLILAKGFMDNKQGNLTDKQVEKASVIHDAGHDLLYLINDILDISAIESGKMVFQFQSTNLMALLNDLHGLFQPLCEEKHIAFEMGVAPNALPENFMTDDFRLRQILKNLLSNAIKFTHQGRVSLNVLCQPTTQSLLFEVVDTGIGIPEDKQSIIFEAFKQADGSITRSYGGTGLGLAISFRLAGHLQGELELKESSDKGSAFWLRLPLYPKL